MMADEMKDEFKKATDAQGGNPAGPLSLFGFPIKFTESSTVWQNRELKIGPLDASPFVILKTALSEDNPAGAYVVSQEFIDKLNEPPPPDDSNKVHKMEWVWRDDGSPSWWCGCGLCDYEGSRRDCLRDFLNAFSDGPTEFGSFHIDSKKIAEVRKRWTPQAIDVIAYLLDELGYMEHGGSVCCSQWLTPEGERLRAWANDEKWEDD